MDRARGGYAGLSAPDRVEVAVELLEGEHLGDLFQQPPLVSLESVEAVVDAFGQVYLRYSRGPAADLAKGYSRDYESGLPLPGLSVTTLLPERWWTRPTRDWVARRICKYAELAEEDRFPWVLSGTRVGVGPDHEPIVRLDAPIAVVSRPALVEAAQWYHDRFDVARDSRSA